MNTIDTSRMLLELRAMAAEAAQRRAAAAAPAGAGTVDFGSVLKNTLEHVNGLQTNASSLATAFERGQPGVDLPRVMLETQKASIAFKAVSEVRNKLVNAYQEVMNMPI